MTLAFTVLLIFLAYGLKHRQGKTTNWNDPFTVGVINQIRSRAGVDAFADADGKSILR